MMTGMTYSLLPEAAARAARSVGEPPGGQRKAEQASSNLRASATSTYVYHHVYHLRLMISVQRVLSMFFNTVARGRVSSEERGLCRSILIAAPKGGV